MKLVQLQTASFAIIAILSVGTTPVFANGDHTHKLSQTIKPILVAQADMAEGEIKRIKSGSKKVTIKHGEIPSLEMPPMTMVFEAEDEAMLANLKKGDKVMFQVVDRDGKMIVTKIEPMTK